jgi:hypothetical protein
MKSNAISVSFRFPHSVVQRRVQTPQGAPDAASRWIVREVIENKHTSAESDLPAHLDYNLQRHSHDPHPASVTLSPSMGEGRGEGGYGSSPHHPRPARD